MPKNLRHIYGFGHLHYITFSCYRRLPLLRSARSRTIFVEVLGEIRRTTQIQFSRIRCDARACSPSHQRARERHSLHAIQLLKQRVSHRLGKHWRTGAAKPQLRVWVKHDFDNGAAFWQKRFYDFNVWTQKKKIEKLNYMHMNPVKSGLLARPDLWIWSSYSAYQGKGRILIPIDRVEP